MQKEFQIIYVGIHLEEGMYLSTPQVRAVQGDVPREDWVGGGMGKGVSHRGKPGKHSPEPGDQGQH